MEPINIRYLFKFPDDRKEVIDLYLDPQTLGLMNEITEELPAWTKLDFNKCPHCLLDIQNHPYCPVAVHLMKVLAVCANLLSYETIHVEIITHERSVSKETSAQKGISSLMGLIMATSGCPHTTFLKPMARFHLPLASIEETMCRAVSMYLLAQYFLRKQGRKTDLDLEGLKKIYSNIKLINVHMADRLRSIIDEDAAVNALTILDNFAHALPFVIEESLEDIRYLFTPYFEQTDDYAD
jgi:hypothetical protein